MERVFGAWDRGEGRPERKGRESRSWKGENGGRRREKGEGGNMVKKQYIEIEKKKNYIEMVNKTVN